MQLDLNQFESALVTVGLDKDRRILAEIRRAERKIAKLRREQSNGTRYILSALSVSRGITIPENAQVGLDANGVGHVAWRDEKPTAAKIDDTKKDAPDVDPDPTPAPSAKTEKTNGALAHA